MRFVHLIPILTLLQHSPPLPVRALTAPGLSFRSRSSSKIHQNSGVVLWAGNDADANYANGEDAIPQQKSSGGREKGKRIIGGWLAGLLGAATSNLHISKSLAEGSVGVAGVILTSIANGDVAVVDAPKEAIAETPSHSISSVIVDKDRDYTAKMLETMPPSSIVLPDASTTDTEETTAAADVAAEEKETTAMDTSSDTTPDVSTDKTSSRILEEVESREDDVATAAEEKSPELVFSDDGRSNGVSKGAAISKTDDEKAMFDALSNIVGDDVAQVAFPAVVAIASASAVLSTASSLLSGKDDKKKGEWKVEKPVPYGLQDGTPSYSSVGPGGDKEVESNPSPESSSMEVISSEVALQSMLKEVPSQLVMTGNDKESEPEEDVPLEPPLSKDPLPAAATSMESASKEEATSAIAEPKKLEEDSLSAPATRSPAESASTEKTASDASTYGSAVKSNLPPGVGGSSSYGSKSSLLGGNEGRVSKGRVGSWGPKSQGFATYGLGGSKPLKGKASGSTKAKKEASKGRSFVNESVSPKPLPDTPVKKSVPKKGPKEWKFQAPTPYGLQKGTPKSSTPPPKTPAPSTPDVVSLPKSFKVTSKGLGSTERMASAGISMANVMKGKTGTPKFVGSSSGGPPKQKSSFGSKKQPTGSAPDVVSLPPSFKATSKGLGSAEKMASAGISMARLMKGKTGLPDAVGSSVGIEMMKKKESSPPIQPVGDGGMLKGPSLKAVAKSAGGAPNGVVSTPKSFSKSASKTASKSISMSSIMKGETREVAGTRSGEITSPREAIKSQPSFGAFPVGEKQKASTKSFAKSSYKKILSTPAQKGAGGAGSSFLSDLSQSPPSQTKEGKPAAGVPPKSFAKSASSPKGTVKKEAGAQPAFVAGAAGGGSSLFPPTKGAETPPASGAQKSWSKTLLKAFGTKSFAKAPPKGSADGSKAAGGAFGIPPRQSFGKASSSMPKGGPKSYAKSSLKGSGGGKGTPSGYLSDLKASATGPKAASFSPKKRKSFGKTASFGKTSAAANTGGGFLSGLSQASVEPGSDPSPAEETPKSSALSEKGSAPIQEQPSPPTEMSSPIGSTPSGGGAAVASPSSPTAPPSKGAELPPRTTNVAGGPPQQQVNEGYSIGSFGGARGRNSAGYPVAYSRPASLGGSGTQPGTIESSDDTKEGYPPDARVVGAGLEPPGGITGEGGEKPLSVTVTDPRTGKKRTISVSNRGR